MTRRYWFSAVAALSLFGLGLVNACEPGFDQTSKMLLRNLKGMRVKGCELTLNERNFWVVQIYSEPFNTSTTLPKDTDPHKWANRFEKLLRAPVKVN
jgi:hypothetical protein